MQFRKDINGLRAIAVVAVVLFHFNESWVPGGFAGVDVFFVISGFLMTGIIFRGIELGNFSILKFYVARGNRIIPALAVLCFVLLIFGWFFLSPIDYKFLGKHISSSVGFLSNIVYWKESGYFEAASHDKWLLHTWSLAVEWQFYIIYPVLLVIMRKFMSLKFIKATLLLITAFGFVFCAIATYKWPNPSYFLLPTRAWEMMIGGIAYLYPMALTKNRKKLAEWLGLTLILTSYFLISKNNPWPGYLAVFPVLGAYLIIQAQRNDSLFTSNIVFQKFGAWSYSIYLWHWPLVVGIYYYSLNEMFIYFGIILSVCLGFLSYTYIEKIRFKNDFYYFRDYIKCKPIYMLLGVGIFGFIVMLSDGLIARFSDDIQKMNKNALSAIGDWDYPKFNLKVDNSRVVFIKGSSEKNILFIGASHIEHTYPYVKSFGSKYNIYYLTRGGCFVTPSFINPKWGCSNVQNYEGIINEIGFDKIVTSIYSFDSYLSEDNEVKAEQIETRIKEYNEFLQFAKSKSDEVFIILGEPKGREFDPKISVSYDLKKYITVDQARENYKLHYNVLDKLEVVKGTIIIDPIDYLCNEVCKVMDDNFNYYYRDETHFRPWYAKKSLEYLDSILK